MHENWAHHLSNNLRLQESTILIFFQFYRKINRNQLEKTHGLKGADKIKDLPISIDFQI